MNILFINLSLRPDAKRRLLPVGLAYVMTAVSKAGYAFDLLDMDIDALQPGDIEQRLGEKNYDVCAFGCIVTGFKLVKEITAILRKSFPETMLVAGNSVATSIPEILLQNTDVDVAVLGEGDVTMVELLRAKDAGTNLSTIAGIAYKNSDGSVVRTPPRPFAPNLDDFGYPDWSLFDLAKYDAYSQVNCNAFFSKTAKSFPLNTGRGCPHSCTFCYHVFKGGKYRRYTEESIIGEIKRLHQEFGATYIMFWDELTFPHIKAVKALMKQLAKLDFKIGWDAPCRAGLFKKEDIPLIQDMRELGCENIAFSLENGSPEILQAMNKKITVNQFIEQAESLWKGGVPPRTSVIFGYPQESPESIRQTLEICERCNIFPSVGFLLPLPGTPIYQWAIDNGHIPNEVSHLMSLGDRQDFQINLTSMSDEELVERVRTGLERLAEKQGLELESVFKTVTYQKPRKMAPEQDSASQ